MATVKMRKGDLFADIFDSPETIAQARREGYSLFEAEDISRAADITELTKNELLELARQKGIYNGSFVAMKKSEIIERINAACSQKDEAEGDGTPAIDGLTDDVLAGEA
jgi:hypothetical protein